MKKEKRAVFMNSLYARGGSFSNLKDLSCWNCKEELEFDYTRSICDMACNFEFDGDIDDVRHQCENCNETNSIRLRFNIETSFTILRNNS